MIDDFAVAAAPDVVVGPVLVADLAPGLAAPVLSALFETGIPVGPTDAIVEPSSVDVSAVYEARGNRI